jgi:hypothetical protein
MNFAKTADRSSTSMLLRLLENLILGGKVEHMFAIIVLKEKEYDMA